MDLDILKPKIQGNFLGEEVNGVFASSDPLWAMFFALIDRDNYSGSLRNGSFLLSFPEGLNERYYFFSINQAFTGNI